jgi:hypothetical protein
MTDAAKFSPEVRAEHLVWPPDEPLIRIPLTGAVEQGAELVDETPEAQVDAFLEANADVFGAVDDAYKDVKTVQKYYETNLKTLQEKTSGSGAGFGRSTRRWLTGTLSEYLNIGVMFGMGKYRAGERYSEIIKKIAPDDDDQPLEAKHGQFVDALQSYLEEKGSKQPSMNEDNPNFINDFLVDAGKFKWSLISTNMYALFRQDIAHQKLQKFLEDDNVVVPFVNRLHELATTSDQLRDYPGLLELVATHIKQDQQKNMLQTAIQRSAPAPETYAGEFLQNVEEKREGLPKEFSVALGCMDVVADIIESEYGLDRQGLLQLFANKVEAWPPEFQARLTAFANGKTNDTWTSIRDRLNPFVRIGRLPPEVAQERMTLKPPPKTNRGDIPDRAAAQTKHTSKVTLVRGGGHEDIIGDTEKEPISHYAVLEAKGDKAGMRFYVETVDTIEDLFALTNFEDYVKTHSQDKSLRPMLEAVIERLRVAPKDRTYTTTIKNGEYIPEGTGLSQRTARRFSPQHMPEAKGAIATKTRIIYDVFNFKGHPTLVIHGAFIKADVENMSGLPRIR